MILDSKTLEIDTLKYFLVCAVIPEIQKNTPKMTKIYKFQWQKAPKAAPPHSA